MKHIILGTAGHIDHGKTSLVKALTGVDTDRLKEEKERGITIELGFAPLRLPSGLRVGVVDVPGHERFVRTMVAGATGIDLVALIIAADEGVMPQTREHLDICKLLGIQAGVVVLTKADLVNEDWMELVREDVREFVQGSFLEGEPVIAVSAVTGQNLPELLAALDEQAQKAQARSVEGLFRLPIDRVFIMRGFGTVVTGTLVAGQVRVGETVEVLPPKFEAKVRGIQVHNQAVEAAIAGQRTAINLQGIEKEAIERGYLLAHPGTLEPAYLLDVWLDYLPSAGRPLKNRTKVRAYFGTSEAMTRVVLLDRDELEPGQQALAQLRLEVPVATLPRDRFVIRSESPMYTIGGGEVVEAQARKHRRHDPEVLTGLHALRTAGEEEGVELRLRGAGVAGLALREIQMRTALSPRALGSLIQSLAARGRAVCYDPEAARYVHAEPYARLLKETEAGLTAFHKANPLKPAMTKVELKAALPAVVDPKLFLRVLADLAQAGTIAVDRDEVRLTSHRVELKAAQRDLRQRLETIYLESGLTPPFFSEVAEQLSPNKGESKAVLDLLLKEGLLVKVKEDLYFHRQAIEDLKGKLQTYFAQHDELGVLEFKAITQATRKYSIPLLEYLDATRFTMRVGEKRRLRERAG
ncbi:MAG: selenocysteine-specific translation elongation factor [Deltaproteobacteria bacterium]|nr:selenocysteine-specific translation elongation factor [Deltaproteobacteria bacterium]